MANIKISPYNVNKTIEYIKKEWEALSPNLVFEYSFLDESLDKQYKSEKRIVEIFGYFSMVAIFIASLGLLGLASFTAEQRTKEIGIRKVLGASIFSIVLLHLKGYLKWVLAASLIAWPIAYIAMNKWLESFAYRINPGLPTFILSTFAMLIIAIIVVSFQSIKAALKNPVNFIGYR